MVLAASTQAVVNYIRNRYVSQEKIVKIAKGSIVNEGGSIFDVERVLDYYSLDFENSSKVLSFSTIKREIDNDRPMLLSIKLTNGGGHLVVIDGYEENDNRKRNYVYYFDPANGGHERVVPYDEIGSNPAFSWK